VSSSLAPPIGAAIPPPPSPGPATPSAILPPLPTRAQAPKHAPVHTPAPAPRDTPSLAPPTGAATQPPPSPGPAPPSTPLSPSPTQTAVPNHVPAHHHSDIQRPAADSPTDQGDAAANPPLLPPHDVLRIERLAVDVWRELENHQAMMDALRTFFRPSAAKDAPLESVDATLLKIVQSYASNVSVDSSWLRPQRSRRARAFLTSSDWGPLPTPIASGPDWLLC
jgi:hypothetical protein